MTVPTWVVVAVAAVAAGDAGLTVIAVRHRFVLAGVAGVLGLASVAFAAARGVSDGEARSAVAIALVLLIIGTVLLGLGSALGRLLEDRRDGGGS